MMYVNDPFLLFKMHTRFSCFIFSFFFIEILDWIVISNILKAKTKHRIESIHINELTGITRLLNTFTDISKKI